MVAEPATYGQVYYAEIPQQQSTETGQTANNTKESVNKLTYTYFV